MERKLKNMTEICITERAENQNNLFYLTTSLSELLERAECSGITQTEDNRSRLTINCPEQFINIIKAELADKIAEVIVVNYKYKCFLDTIRVTGLEKMEKEILLTSLIAADLTEDKKYTFEKIKELDDIAIDGVYNFRLTQLKKKWKDISSYMPTVFVNNQLKEFLKYLLENKKRKVYIDNGKVYDNHYRKLNRCDLLPDFGARITREIIMSNCGEIEISGRLEQDDEFYLREYFGDKIYFSTGYLS